MSSGKSGNITNGVERLYSAGDTAEILGLKECTIRKWLLFRRIRSVKVGRAIRVPGSEIARLIAQGEVPARPEPSR